MLLLLLLLLFCFYKETQYTRATKTHLIYIYRVRA